MNIWEWLFVGFAVSVVWVDGWLTRKQMRREAAELEARLYEVQQTAEKRKGGETG